MRLLVEAISCLPKGEESNQADDPSITLAIAPSESVLTLMRASGGPRPEWKLGPFVFRVLEEVPPEMLTDRERVYHAANPGGYRGGANDGRRWTKWDGK
jgi:hypothetical protein